MLDGKLWHRVSIATSPRLREIAPALIDRFHKLYSLSKIAPVTSEIWTGTAPLFSLPSLAPAARGAQGRALSPEHGLHHHPPFFSNRDWNFARPCSFGHLGRGVLGLQNKAVSPATALMTGGEVNFEASRICGTGRLVGVIAPLWGHAEEGNGSSDVVVNSPAVHCVLSRDCLPLDKISRTPKPVFGPTPRPTSVMHLSFHHTRFLPNVFTLR